MNVICSKFDKSLRSFSREVCVVEDRAEDPRMLSSIFFVLANPNPDREAASPPPPWVEENKERDSIRDHASSDR